MSAAIQNNPNIGLNQLIPIYLHLFFLKTSSVQATIGAIG
ncbi:hypothetical protein NEIELOOT_00464 [Neisseria elongata subsp. glycolytica ATCC 29315]|uniref:Uncharacterized protein n=1 Tax=Neisseria elongata subsp. glycolytica ATCC 29315 TaxID=546263 RepID=D4DN40_NEIEG|nr:hypothetical protein NEIELOOT_00464 [Neisseria elongata subsp. glycolytica ATCC 29315]